MAPENRVDSSRDAHQLKAIRIFISSPGDVDTERKIAGRVIERLSAEFAGQVKLDPFFWEYAPISNHKTFQDQIPPTSDFDLVVCILWSRLGTPLKGPDGKDYSSGTAYEVASAKESFAKSGIPELMIYWNQTNPRVPIFPKEERDELNRQWDALVDFLERNCKDLKTGWVKGGYTSYRDLGEFEDRLEQSLREFVKSKLPTGDNPAGAELPPVSWNGCPYRGLQTFEAVHAPIFFGRTKAIGEVMALLKNRSLQLKEAREAAISGATNEVDPSAAIFLLVSAMSGVGKSSLIRAGVLPLLTQPGNEIQHWRKIILKPSQLASGSSNADGTRDIFDALANTLVQPDGLPELIGGEINLREIAFLLRKNPAGIDPLVKQALNQVAFTARIQEEQRLDASIRTARQHGRVHDVERYEVQRATLQQGTARLVFVVDQMEELYTAPEIDTAARAQFVQSLKTLARSGSVWLIATMRSDYFVRCAEIPDLMDLKKGEGTYDLKPPDIAEIGQVIRRPAQAAGLKFQRDPETDKSLDEELRDVAARSPEALPLLEFALEQLYEKRTPEGLLTWAAYSEIGRLEGAIAKRADEVLQKLSPQAKISFATVVPQLVRFKLDGTESPVRQWASLKDIETSRGPKELIRAFIDARLLQTDTNERGESIIGFTHEAVIRSWKHLADWIAQHRDLLEIRANIHGSLLEWQQQGNKPGYLLPKGARLNAARRMRRKNREYLSRDEANYVKLSSRRAHRSSFLSKALLTLALLLAIPITIIGAFFLDIHETFAAGKLDESRYFKTISHYLRAGALEFSGRKSKAIEAYESALETSFRFFPARMFVLHYLDFMIMGHLLDMLRNNKDAPPPDTATLKAFLESIDFFSQSGIFDERHELLLASGCLDKVANFYEGRTQWREGASCRSQEVGKDWEIFNQWPNTDVSKTDLIDEITCLGRDDTDIQDYAKAASCFADIFKLGETKTPSSEELNQKSAFSISEFRYRYGELLSCTGDFTSAKEQFLESIRCDRFMLDKSNHDRSRRSSLANSLKSLAHTEIDLGDWDNAQKATGEAIDFCRQNLRENPTNIEYKRSLASALDSLASVFYGQTENQDVVGKALQFYTEAISLAPQDGNYLAHRGFVYALLGQKMDSLADFGHAQTVDPQNFRVEQILGWAELRLRDPSATIQAWDKAHEMVDSAHADTDEEMTLSLAAAEWLRDKKNEAAAIYKPLALNNHCWQSKTFLARPNWMPERRLLIEQIRDFSFPPQNH